MIDYFIKQNSINFIHHYQHISFYPQPIHTKFSLSSTFYILFMHILDTNHSQLYSIICILLSLSFSNFSIFHFQPFPLYFISIFQLNYLFINFTQIIISLMHNNPLPKTPFHSREPSKNPSFKSFISTILPTYQKKQSFQNNNINNELTIKNQSQIKSPKFVFQNDKNPIARQLMYQNKTIATDLDNVKNAYKQLEMKYAKLQANYSKLRNMYTELYLKNKVNEYDEFEQEHPEEYFCSIILKDLQQDRKSILQQENISEMMKKLEGYEQKMIRGILWRKDGGQAKELALQLQKQRNEKKMLEVQILSLKEQLLNAKKNYQIQYLQNQSIARKQALKLQYENKKLIQQLQILKKQLASENQRILKIRMLVEPKVSPTNSQKQKI